jgi:Trypsin
VQQSSHNFFSFSNFTIHLGSNYRVQSDPSRVEIITSVKYVHPNYSRTYQANDIALIKLPSPVTITSKKIHFHLYSAYGQLNFNKRISVNASQPKQICLIYLIIQFTIFNLGTSYTFRQNTILSCYETLAGYNGVWLNKHFNFFRHCKHHSIASQHGNKQLSWGPRNCQWF